MYNVRPLGSVSTSPSAVVETLTAGAAVGLLEVELGLLADGEPPPAESPEPFPPQAASSATAPAATTSPRPDHLAMTEPLPLLSESSGRTQRRAIWFSQVSAV